MSRRPALEIVREAAWVRMGWEHADALVAGSLLVGLVKFAARACALAALAFAGYWISTYVPRPVVAGLSWTVGMCALVVAGFAGMRRVRTRVLTTIAAGSFIALAVLLTTTKGIGQP